VTSLRSVPEVVLLRQRRAWHPFRRWLSFLLLGFITEQMLQTRFFSCQIPLLPSLIFECLVDCAFCVLPPLLVVLGPEYLIPIQFDLDHFQQSSSSSLFSLALLLSLLTVSSLSIFITNCSSSCAPSCMLSYIFPPTFLIFLKQHVKRLFKTTPTAAVVICSGRGGKCNGTYIGSLRES